MVGTFNTVLVANRGEIALRIMRSARAMGLKTIAVYSEADRDSLHVAYADDAVYLGPAAANESYRCVSKIIQAARLSGAQAIHPGYGFLAENAEFAQAAEEANLIFIGPSPISIDSMGNKAQAKEIMIAAGVPCIPGYQGLEQDDQTLLNQCDRIGLPLMIKAAAGGGGRGMRLVQTKEEMLPALHSARSEALAAFGSDQLILERAIMNARHVEIQVFGDQHGNVIHLGERDCSVQRRHQKLIEESPCPAVDAVLRNRMGKTAVAAAKAINYVGAGTLEFLLGDDGHFWFMEMNTRLQVEHGVTELVTGLDLVQWQIHVARGLPLPLRQDEVKLNGHAMEVRLCAEDPNGGFLPQTGTVLAWEPDPLARVDAALQAGMQVSAFYDSMLAKIMVHADSREECIQKLINACRHTTLLGLRHNLPFLQNCLGHENFLNGHATTTFIDEHLNTSSLKQATSSLEAQIAAALIFTKAYLSNSWTNAIGLPHIVKFSTNNEDPIIWHVDTSDRSGNIRLSVQGKEESSTVANVEQQGSELLFDLNSQRHHARFEFENKKILWIQFQGVFYNFVDSTHQHQTNSGSTSQHLGIIRAPLAGRIIKTTVQTGQTIKSGDPLVAIESMKMEHMMYAESDGLIEEVSCTVGDQVMAGRVLVRIKSIQIEISN